MLVDFEELEERIKDILATEEKSTKIIDIAEALEISPRLYYKLKNQNRDKLVLRILNFLAKKYLPINLILFDQTNKKVQKELRKYPMIKNIQENLENINKEKNEHILGKEKLWVNQLINHVSKSILAYLHH